MIVTYGVFGGLTAILLLMGKPETSPITQYVGDVPYQVPREFVFSSGTKGLTAEMCLETLQGVYSPNLSCNTTSIDLRNDEILFPESLKRLDEFDYDGEQVIFREGSDQYFEKEINGVRAYKYRDDWPEELVTEEVPVPTQFQVDDDNHLIGTVQCQRWSSKNNLCDRRAKTSLGILLYQVRDSITYDVEYWLETDDRLVTLFESWKVEE